MNIFSSWTISVCISAVVASLFELLVPKGNMEKMFRFILGAFMVCVVLLPINTLALDLKNSFSFKSYDYKESDYCTYVNEKYINSAKNILYSQAQEAISKLGIIPQNIDINMDITDDYSISMILIKVKVSEDYSEKVQNIEEIIYSETGVKCEVYVEGNE